MMRSQLNRITQLARAGALAQAWALFEAGGPHAPGSADDPETLSVYGRLLKDRAAREEGMLVGISSGATLAGIAQKLPELGEHPRILGFNYDTGERYLSVPDFLPQEG